MVHLNRDSVIAVILLIFCGSSFWDISTIESFEMAAMGSDAWPLVILLALTCLSLLLLGRSLWHPKETWTGGGLKMFILSYRNPLWCYALFGLYLLTLDYLGMLIGSVLFVFSVLTVLGPRNPKKILIHGTIAVSSVGIVWAIFSFVLRVFLPQGEILNVW